MLVINANQELRQVFDRLMEEMDAQVVWNGRFLIMGDRLILEGLVRSWFFHFDIQKVMTELADLPEDDGKELEIAEYPGLADLITMAVYAFEKFGAVWGITVKQDVQQLNQIFGEILGIYHLKADFSEEHIEFYKSGMRITYEDVIEDVIAQPQARVQAPVLQMPEFELPYAGADRPQTSDSPLSAGSGTAGAAKGQDISTAAGNSQAAAERIEKYHARISVLDRLSDFQRKALLRDIRNDRLLSEQEKEALYYPIQDYEYQKKMNAIEEALKECRGSRFLCIQKLIQNTEQEELFEKTKQAVLEKLKELRQQYGIQEVKAVMENVPQHVERAEYQELMEQLAPYEGIDLSDYEQTLRKMRETLEIKEISNMLMQSQKKDRRDYMKLLRRIEEQDFAEENASPYIERILDWVSELDEARLKELLFNVRMMDFKTAASVYDAINRKSFLPGLKESAKAAVSKRLEEVCLSDCRLLVRAFEKNMSGVIKENPRHHFYPAEQILSKTAVPDDIKLIEHAVSAYAEGKSRFEYPIFMADTSKECNGRDGMLLTPGHLYYSTRINGYQMTVESIKSIYAASGLLNHKTLIAEEENGVRHRLPYAADAEELKDWADLLDKFVRFLKARAASGKMPYELLREPDGITCKRCGCLYEGAQPCPECGYKKNG